ncbi:hypothetical protein BOTBODRAFT_412650 [Botryobasidium botryosum FD-172 SS1]|uniref:G domain-containing protein n=1 Tax=Botryobasidium botryosum (strain FD-172 SS1) TaxID=930990 RepID=A0A067ML21_BOTB1|nr:hypothetical protein BOTBODRAFT_412650 [Botryobasidium botryosum FD-172 SS1]
MRKSDRLTAPSRLVVRLRLRILQESASLRQDSNQLITRKNYPFDTMSYPPNTMSYPLNTMTEAEVVQRPNQFRILIIGRANAGKTTVLRAVCGAEGEPKVYDKRDREITPGSMFRATFHSVFARTTSSLASACHLLNPAPSSSAHGALNSIISPSALRGLHNVEYSLVFSSNPAFIFHDSRGFESGVDDELELVRKFIQSRASLGSMKNQLHAIWYCFPTDGNRFMTAAETKFFAEIDTGSVPVIAVFTKFDSLDAAAYTELCASGVSDEDARLQAPRYAQEKFNQQYLPILNGLAHPPRAVVCLRSNF